MRLREACGWALVAGLALIQTSCLLPVRTAPGVEGRVVDGKTGEPVPGALVVVRFDGRYGDKLPDREHLGHVEITTGPDGSFQVGRFTRGGLTVWPLFQSEARVVAVLRSGYLCAKPAHVTHAGRVRILLEAALDLDHQRSSCRPVASRRGEAESYRAAWRSLFPAPETAEQREQRRQVDRTLEARAALGFGQNCEGPVTDLAIAPGGHRAAFVVAGREGPEVQLTELGPEAPGVPKLATRIDDAPARRLAWTGPGELVLWAPSTPADRAISPSVMAPGRSEVVWSSSRALPTTIDRGTPASSKRTTSAAPLDPEDLSDEADTLWLGRSFSLERTLDAKTGLAHDRLRVTLEDGERRQFDLPGEACGGPRFGRPHYRIGAGGRLGVDLRFVDGGCHSVSIDLATGNWTRLDRADVPAVCRAQRRIPPGQLATALRGWSNELSAVLEGAGADTGAAYALRIAPNGGTTAIARDHAGAAVEIPAPKFPVATPLRRIDVTNVAPITPGSRVFRDAPPAALEPL
jgi:hypothetical protein